MSGHDRQVQAVVWWSWILGVSFSSAFPNSADDNSYSNFPGMYADFAVQW